jgi:hypothetical protein
MRQTKLFDPQVLPSPVTSGAPAPEVVRKRLHIILEEARNASEMPWAPSRARAIEHLFRNMTKWLPESEGEDLRKSFLQQISRLSQVSEK